jgi:primosomal protein N' (replication factor Y)
VALVLHKPSGAAALRCHLCGHSEPERPSCPQCGGQHLLALGGGTEKVEEELAERLPSARVGRLDRDAISTPGEAAALLARFARRELDVLIGTQMVAKGHDFPGVTLVGVLNADGALHLPDFRAAERCVQLLAQVAGRAGRGEQPGRVLLQAFRPEEPAVQVALTHDAAAFAETELQHRKALGFPPWTRLLALRLSGNAEPRVRAAAEALATEARRAIAQGEQADVLGPASSPLARLRGKHRWQLVLRAGDHAPLHRLALRMRAWHAARGPEGVELALDMDPVSLL